MPESRIAARIDHRVTSDGSLSLTDLSTRPPADAGSSAKWKKELGDRVEQLHELQRRLYADGRYAVLVVFQAMDAAGKDSTIRKVFSGVNPAGFRCIAFGPPSHRERAHDFLWRCQSSLPARGKIGLFNRSHYEEVLVVRVHPELLSGQRLPNIDPATIWDQRMESIRQWEQHLTRNGTVVIKFFLNVSPDEQKRRLLARIDRPDKNWKFEAADLDVRERWDDYMHAYQEALRHTARPHAPWYAIPADSKPYMRLAVARIMVETLEALELRYPEVDETQQAQLAASRARLMAED